jgi:arylsulfatase
MADDMGYSDIGCYGSEIRTPHIDSLAKGGVRFTHFHNTARCCPTRASLLTGLYAHQAGIGHMVNPRPLPGYAGDLNRSCVTIAEVLRAGGYQTMASGKWHVTPVTDSKHNWPLQRGFEKYYGIIHGSASYFQPSMLVRDNEKIAADSKDFYLTDGIGENAAAYIQAAARKPDPFFLYVPFTSPHWPLHAFEADIARYKGRYAQGWDTLRTERQQRMIRMGLLDKRWGLTPRDREVPAWKDAPDKAWQERRMEVYAAQIDRMDQNVGRILDALRASGQEDNTLVLFLADNGGCAEDLAPGNRTYSVPEKTREGRAVQPGNVTGTHARRRRHVPELRHRLGQRVEHALPPLQALGARRRYLHAPDCALAERHPAPQLHHSRTGPSHRPDGYLRGHFGRAVSRAARRRRDSSDGRPQSAPRLRRQTHPARRRDLLGA